MLALPLWAFWGMLIAVLSAAMMLLQEKFKVDGFAMAVWCKVACIIVTFPFVLIYGLPDNPLFYLFLSFQAVLYAISDVVLFRAIPVVGAGVISRLFPVTIILSFLLWFAVDPALIPQYLDRPLISLSILAVLALTAYFSMSLRRCEVSMNAVRLLWFALFANILGPINAKLVVNNAALEQGPFAFTFVEAWMMIALWLLYWRAAKPITAAAFFKKECWQGGLVVGSVMAAMVMAFMVAFYHVDNPGYISAIKLLDAVVILGAHKLLGKQDGSNVYAGLGIVACAIALIVLKSQI